MNVITGLVLAVLAAASADSPAEVTKEPPAKVTFLARRDGKPELRYYDVNLVIQNKHKKPMWFILRYWGEEALPKKTEFNSQQQPGAPFDGREYAFKGKRVAQIRHHGEDKFIAYQLAANTTLEISVYSIEAWETIRDFEIWEVSCLKVNDKTPLDKWLPYDTLSGNKAKNRQSKDWINLDWDPGRFRSRSDYPDEVVKSVTLSGIRKWTIPLDVKDSP